MAIDSIELSKELIACESVTPNASKALDLLQSHLELLGFTCERMIFSEEGTEDVDNLYARYGSEEPHLCFAGHLDVVPPGDLSHWETPPFLPEIRDGMLYGRGTSDMKCAIACFTSAVSEYLEENKSHKGSISFLITGDEEGPSINGTKKMLPKLAEQKEKWDACIVGEPTSVSEVGDTIKIGRRGSVNFSLVVMGKQGHVAYPHLADNPVSRLINILQAVNSHVLDEGTDYFQPSNLEIVTIDVDNNADNVIPAVAQAKFNIRFNDQHTSATLIKWVEGICESLCDEGDAKYTLEHRVSGESFITKPGRLSDIMTAAVQETTGRQAELSTSGGTSDARFIKDYCPVVELGLTNATAHKVDEHVPADDVKILKDIYKKALSLFFKEK